MNYGGYRQSGRTHKLVLELLERMTDSNSHGYFVVHNDVMIDVVAQMVFRTLADNKIDWKVLKNNRVHTVRFGELDFRIIKNTYRELDVYRGILDIRGFNGPIVLDHFLDVWDCRKAFRR